MPAVPSAWKYNAQPGTSDAALFTALTPGAGQSVFASLIAVNNTALARPAAPATATATTGGTIAAGTYQVVITYTNANGETLPSNVSSQVTTGATSTLTITSPAAQTGATGWYAYVTQPGGAAFTRQQGTPTAIATNLVLTAPPTSTGANPPVSNTSGTAVTVSLSVQRAISGAAETICSALSIPSGSAVSLLDDPRLAMEEITLSPGDSLHGSASAAASVTVVAF